MFEKYDLDKDDKISLDEFKLFLKEKNHELRSDIPSEVLGMYWVCLYEAPIRQSAV